MDQNIKREFLNEFPIPVGKSLKPFIILFDAYSGMGKSTVSRKIAEYEDVVILNNDQVRRFINDIHDTTDLKNELQEMRLRLLFENNNNCVWDASFSHNYKDKLKLLKEIGYQLFIVRLICDEEIIKKRVDERVLDGVNFSLAPFSNYLWMKENIPLVPDNLIDFVIYTDQDIDSQVKAFIKYIHETK